MEQDKRRERMRRDTRMGMRRDFQIAICRVCQMSQRYVITHQPCANCGACLCGGRYVPDWRQADA